ncbi:hypothetical protein CDL15_Pgr026396 [Punica granatum]|uniref:Uncharacterized protein n=1 Tax=Punica granatum TaxID=22663 RepID=A0A218XNL5_PUNGR|nr:hypothetical protein CDL15_Pgr026396 [Punica granatum]PKI75060.1 hypothetical protein CRG98_004534 [Punica granatum]
MVTTVSTALSPKAAQQGGSCIAISRSLLLPSNSDSNNAVASRRPNGREVSSRYMSALSSNSFSSSTVKRSASPLISRIAVSPAVSTSSLTAPPAAMKHSQSVERRPMATPRPSTQRDDE